MVSDFDFPLPPQLVATQPAEPRDSARLLVYDRATGQSQHQIFRDLPLFLRPGDLLFWVNSTKDAKTDRDPPVTHVMIYLGKRRNDGHPVVAGASDGRSLDGQRMNGVSVFDFKLPSPGSPARFIGYAHLPAAKRK